MWFWRGGHVGHREFELCASLRISKRDGALLDVALCADEAFSMVNESQRLNGYSTPVVRIVRVVGIDEFETLMFPLALLLWYFIWYIIFQAEHKKGSRGL